MRWNQNQQQDRTTVRKHATNLASWPRTWQKHATEYPASLEKQISLLFNIFVMMTAQVQSETDKYTCVGCRVKFDALLLQKEHFKTEWHLYNLKRRVCHLEPINLAKFNEITKVVVDAKNDGDNHNKQNHKGKDGDDVDDDGDWEDIDEDEGDKSISPDTCLFCNRQSSGIKKNIQHMNSLHGFFIPEEKYLIDLEGLMEYLGSKVGVDTTCLWCKKRFASVHGVRLHMMSKDHCKILYDQEEAYEFKEFYDYSTQEYIDMKPLNQLAIPKKRHDRMHNTALVKPRAHIADHKLQLATSRSGIVIAGSYQAKNVKKFEAYRAKIILRTGMANNNTMRGRLRQQNPI